jgi:superfamily II DNA or RNA helicase
LVAILSNGGGKSLVFIASILMLSGSGVTIVVAPYAELKRQLVTRCIGAWTASTSLKHVSPGQGPY